MKPVPQIMFGLLAIGVFAVGGAVAGYFTVEGFKNYNKQSAIIRLDPHSLSLLERINGLIFPGTNVDIGTMRHLINLDLIRAEIFPSDPISFGYYLTEEGSNILTKRLKKELYPQIFCDLIRVRYWKDHPSDFIKKKDKFKKDYKISWDKCWEIFDQQIRVAESEKQGDALEIFNGYLTKNSFNTIMEKIVKPWLKKINPKKDI